VSKSFDDVSKTPSTSTKPPKRSVETIKPETTVKPQSVSEGISKAKAEGKSFDEFVGSKEKVYHGTDATFKDFDVEKIKEGGAIFFSKDKKFSKRFGKNLKENFIDKNSKIFDYKNKNNINELKEYLDKNLSGLKQKFDNNKLWDKLDKWYMQETD
jgi:hypothetical protein